MKIENKEIGIKIGDKELKFTNMILNSYLDLFADSFIEFKNKDLPYCLLNFIQMNDEITEDSTEMNYDLILEADFNKNIEVLSSTSIVNKYYYRNPQVGQEWSDFVGYKIKEIGFANYDYTLNKYVIYAYLNVSNYEIYVQDDQPIIISRIDKITTDMNLWGNSSKIKAPYHLSMRGMLNYEGMEYFRTIPKLYSVGFGVLPYTLNKEYLTEDLIIQRGNTGMVEIQDILEAQYRPNTKYFNTDICFDNWYFEEPTYNYMIYKFKLYKETYSNPEEDPVWIDTGLFYTQYKKVKKNGNIKLSVKYERS